MLSIGKSQVLLILDDRLLIVIVEGDASFLQAKSENKHMIFFLPFKFTNP